MREKTYEEALAEQRQQAQALLGIKQTKSKEKKKKTAKKTKDKTTVSVSPDVSSEVQSFNDSENTKINCEDPSNQVLQNHLQHAGKLHVEFKEDPEVVSTSKELPKKKQETKNQDKPLPAAIIKEKKVQDVIDIPSSIIKTKKKSEKSAEVASNPSSVSSSSQLTNGGVTTVIEKQKEEKPVVASMSSHQIQTGPNPGKEKKKKKNENLQHILTAAEGEGLINLVRNAELSRSEVQKLIDLLLNKQQDNPTFIDDSWSEGKSDPVQKLKKQLAEKEKLLEIEQQALAGAKIKLQEIRAEQQAEKLQLQQKIRYLDEGLQAKHKEMQTINANLQNLTQKMQMQAQNEEILRRLQEENHQLQYRLAQMQEAETLNAKLRKELLDQSTHIQKINMELAQVTNDAFTEKEHNKQLYLQLNNLKQELDQSIEFKRQFEEMKMDYEKKLEKAYRDENEWQREISKITTQYKQQIEELRRVEHESQQLKQEIKQLTANCSESGKLVSQLKAELQKVQEEKAAMNGAVNDDSKIKEYEVQVLNLNNKLSSLESELQQVKLNNKNCLEASAKQYQKLENDLKEQKLKNDDLRAKNWKVVEALNVAENRLLVASKAEVDVKKLSTDIRNEEQTGQRKFLERLFENIEFKNSKSDNWQQHYEELIKSYIKNLEKKAEEGNKTKNTKISSNSLNENDEIIRLRAQVTHYQKTVDEHVEYLAELEEKIEQGERRMQQRLAEKDEELVKLKECFQSELEHKIEDLEQQLLKERSENLRLHHDLEKLNFNTTDSSAKLTTKKLLNEEVENIINFQNGELASKQTTSVNTTTSTNGSFLSKDKRN